MILLIILVLLFYFYYSQWNDSILQAEFSSSKDHLGIKYQQVYKTIKNEGLKCAKVRLNLSTHYVLADLNLIKKIMTKDFDYFPHRGLYYNAKKNPLSCHLFNISGTQWKNVRSQLNNVFTWNKIKTIFPILLNCQENLMKKLKLEQNPIDVKNVVESFVYEVIEFAFFGLDFRSFEDKSTVQEAIQKILNRSLSRKIKGLIVENFPRLGQILDIALIPKDVSDCFLEIVQKAIDSRKSVREDLLQFFIDSKLTSKEIVAQIFIFFVAGVSSSPCAITFALYELAKSQEMQDRVRDEIFCVLAKNNMKISYDCIHKMKYLDKVLNESLRKYPPAAYLNRKCVKDYTFGTTVIKKGSTVVVPVLGLHHDEEWYLNPHKFKPERFKNGNPPVFIPFGQGPRICIGMRFGLVQSKLALISFLQNFKLSVNKKTEEVLKMRSDTLVLTSKSGIWLDIDRID